MHNDQITYIACNQCDTPYPAENSPYRCPKCGGIFGIAESLPFDPQAIEPDLPGIWRYRHSFLLSPQAPITSLGEGQTPLIWIEENGQKVGLKLESMNPTGSYKDRGTSVLLSHLIQRGASSCVEDSSGNAGASLAAYTAHFHLPSKIYAPATTSEVKLRQILLYGSEIIRVPGPRQNAADEVIKAANDKTVYASHAYQPFGLPGIATIAYECWETLKMCPGTVIAPVGHGGLLAGIILGFQSLYDRHIIDRLPYFVGVQPAACAPLVKAFREGPASIQNYVGTSSLAEGTLITKPARLKELWQLMEMQNGEFIAIEEEEILPAYHQLARQGIWVEPTSVLAWCAYHRLGEKLPEPIVIILTGAGYKYQPK